MADIGVKVLKSNISSNFLTEENPDNYSLWSRYPTLKLRNTGTLTMTTPAANYYIAETAIDHDLGYVPIVFAMMQDQDDGASPINGGTPFWLRLPSSLYSQPIAVEYAITSTQITFRAENDQTSPSGFSKSIPIKYWLFSDKLADN